MSLETIYQTVLEGNAKGTEVAVKEALAAGTSPEDIMYKACIPAMSEVGRQFEEGEMFVPEMLIAARAMQAGMVILKPLLLSKDIKPAGRVVIGTVQGDLHDIGKNLVGMMLEGAGFEIIDLGTDVNPAKFTAAVREHQPQVVAMSSLLTTTMRSMNEIIKSFSDAGVREQIKVIVGGAPVTEDYALSIGADGYAPDASSAVRKAKSLLGVA